MSSVNLPLGQTVFYTTPTTQVVAPEQHDSGNIDIKLAPAYVPVAFPIVPIGAIPFKIKPMSITHEPWIGFGPLENRIFLDDFCHQKDLTIKAQASTYNGAQVKLKEAVNVTTKKGTKKIIKLKQEIKLWFPLYSNMTSALHFRLTNQDSRIHYDHGINLIHDHKVNFYGSFGFLRDWSKYNLKLGFQLLEKNATVDNRIKIDNTYNVKWYHRTTANIDNVRLGLVAGLDVTNKELIKKDLFVGYRKDQFDISLKAEQAFDKVTKDYSDWKQWFSRYYATAVFSRNKKQKYGVQVSFNPVTSNSVVTGLIEYLYSDKGITKIKLDNHLNLSFLVKKTVTDKLALSFGTQIPIVKKQDQRNKFGFQVDLNI